MTYYVMLADYPEFLKNGPGRPTERAVVVPHLFEYYELNKEMTIDRPFIQTSRTMTSNQSMGWDQLFTGAKIVSETLSFRTRKGKTYHVDVTKFPDGKLTWDLRYGQRRAHLLSGTELETLWDILETRITTRMKS